MNLPITKLLPWLLGSLALTLHANPITGQINIQAGSVVLDPNALGAVVSIGGSDDGVVTSVAGVFPTSLDGQLVTYLPFDVAVGAQPITSLWTVADSANGLDYSFNLGAVTSVVQTPTNLFLNGTGVLESSDPSLSGTSGSWSYGINSSNGGPTNGIFSFQSNNSAVGTAADGGNALVLLGLGLLGLIGVSRAVVAQSARRLRRAA
jgi:hypothetical protein